MALRVDDHIRQFIDSHRVARFATVDVSGGPLIVPVCFAFDGTMFFTAVDEKPKSVAASSLERIRNVRKNLRVALLLDDYSEDWSRLAYLLVKGSARVLESPADGVQYATGVALLRAKYAQYRSMAIHRNLLIRIEPVWLKFWSAS